jgi:hypothetical protein
MSVVILPVTWKKLTGFFFNTVMILNFYSNFIFTILPCTRLLCLVQKIGSNDISLETIFSQGY